jgi:hypothetical protein
VKWHSVIRRMSKVDELLRPSDQVIEIQCICVYDYLYTYVGLYAT